MLLLTSLLISGIFSQLTDCTVLRAAVAQNGNSEIQKINEAPGSSHLKNHPRHIEAVTAAVLAIPSSRAYNCFLETNSNCDIFKSDGNVGLIIDSKDFLKNGPQDGQIASAGNSLYKILDEYGTGRWNPSYLKIKGHDDNYFITEIEWSFNKKIVKVDEVNVYLSNSKYNEDEPIAKSSLNLACSYKGSHLIAKDYTLRFDCYIPNELFEDLLYGTDGVGLLLSTLKVAGSNYAFYQVADVSLYQPVSQMATFHGYVSTPLSRAKLCQLRVNQKCGLIVYEPQSVEGSKGFPNSPLSPPDGAIPSGNNGRFKELNEYGADRWIRTPFPEVSCHNQTHVVFNISWYFTAPHKTEKIEVFISNENFKSTEPLARRHLDLDPICTINFWGKNPPSAYNMVCPIKLEQYKRLSGLDELLMLSVWSVYDTSNAFYQVMDLKGLSQEQSYESILQKCQ